MARGGHGGRSRPDTGEPAHSEWRVFRVAGVHAGVYALARPSSAVCEAASPHGGVPPPTDFILWLASRPGAEWARLSAQRHLHEEADRASHGWWKSPSRIRSSRQESEPGTTRHLAASAPSILPPVLAAIGPGTIDDVVVFRILGLVLHFLLFLFLSASSFFSSRSLSLFFFSCARAISGTLSIPNPATNARRLKVLDTTSPFGAREPPRAPEPNLLHRSPPLPLSICPVLVAKKTAS